MVFARVIPVFQVASLLFVVVFATSCDSPQKRGLRALTKAGIEASAKSLVTAATNHDAQSVGWLLDVGVYTEQRDIDGRTPLRIAIEAGDLSSTFLLLDAKAEVNAQSADHASILGAAVACGETAIVERLLEMGARTDGLMPSGERILPWAIREGRLTFVRAMMKSGADPHQKDSAGNPLLHLAMAAGRRDITESLIELGADPSAINAGGETTIQLALNHGWDDLVPGLAGSGADPNARSPNGFTLLEKAVNEANFTQISLLLKIGADPNLSHRPGHFPSPFESAFANSDPRVLETLLTTGSRPASGTSSFWLRKTIGERNLSQARVLLSHGVKADQIGSDGLLPVEAATAAREASFVKLLLDYGNPVGLSLPMAIADGDLDMVTLLLACGADPSLTITPTFITPLSLAIRNNRDDIAVALIRHGASRNLRLPEGQSAFHLAIATGCLQTLGEFLDAGADPNAPFILPVTQDFLKAVRPGSARWALKNERDVTPLMVAIDSGNIETTRLLIKAGAKRSVRTRPNNLWPINFAINRKDVRMTRLVLGKDPHREERQIVITLSEQRARLLDADGNELFTTKISTGRKGYSTPTGEFVITDKNRDWTSTIYHASMPYFQRLNCSAIGLHQGVVPGYPASHGCIRVPAGNAAKLFTMTQAGDRVKILP